MLRVFIHLAVAPSHSTLIPPIFPRPLCGRWRQFKQNIPPGSSQPAPARATVTLDGISARLIAALGPDLAQSPSAALGFSGEALEWAVVQSIAHGKIDARRARRSKRAQRVEQRTCAVHAVAVAP